MGAGHLGRPNILLSTGVGRWTHWGLQIIKYRNLGFRRFEFSWQLNSLLTHTNCVMWYGFFKINFQGSTCCQTFYKEKIKGAFCFLPWPPHYFTPSDAPAWDDLWKLLHNLPTSLSRDLRKFFKNFKIVKYHTHIWNQHGNKAKWVQTSFYLVQWFLRQPKIFSCKRYLLNIQIHTCRAL